MSDKRPLRAAFALAPDRFCVSLNHLEGDDQFSIVLKYDGRSPQPWSRINVPRNVVSVTHHRRADDEIYVALSDEGDVYFLSDDDTVDHEKIVGAGMHSEDASGQGPMNQIANLGGELVACGYGSQVYRRGQDGGWSPTFAAEFESVGSPRAINLTTLLGVSADDFFVCGFVDPTIGAIESEEIDQALLSGDIDLYTRLLTAQVSEPKGCCFHSLAGKWRRVDEVGEAILKAGLVQSPDSIWFVGQDGAIFWRGPMGRFDKRSFHGDTETLISIADFEEYYVVASDFAIHRYDGHHLSPLKPKLTNVRRPSPLAVFGFGDTLIYFDYQREIIVFSDGGWRPIHVPDRLVEADFRALGD